MREDAEMEKDEVEEPGREESNMEEEKNEMGSKRKRNRERKLAWDEET